MVNSVAYFSCQLWCSREQKQHITDASYPVVKKSGTLKHEVMNNGGSVNRITGSFPIIWNTHTFRSKFLLKAPPKCPTCFFWHSGTISRHNKSMKINWEKIWPSLSTDLFFDCQYNRVIIAREIYLKLLQKTRTPNESYVADFTGVLESKASLIN